MYQARIGRSRVLSDGDEMDALVALNQEGYDKHVHELRPGGILIFDNAEVEPPDDGRDHFPIPVTAISEQLEFSRGKNLVMVGSAGWFFRPANRASR